MSASAAMAPCGRLLLWTWLGPVTLEDCDALRDALGEHARRYPDGFVGLTLVRPDVPPPAEDVRLALLSVRRMASDRGMRAEAVVHDTHAWPRGSIDSVSSGLGTLAREICPRRVCDDVEEAMQWLRSRLDDVPPPSAVGAALRSVEAMGRGEG